jgi:four helix bundle protein
MDADELCDRTKKFALRVIKMFRALPSRAEAQVIGKQLLRSATSVAANYRAARRARSHAEFVSRLSVVTEEADETLFWLELLRDSGVVSEARITGLMDEAKELTAIFTASTHTARSNR